MGKTQDDLKAAFAGESQANRRYLAFAEKAEGEGKSAIARLFRVAAAGETVHALNHLQTLGEVKETGENLGAAISGETYEIDKMYPGFLTEAKEKDEKGAIISFYRALEVEKIHQQMFQKALEKLSAGEEILNLEYYVCPICGYPAVGQAPDTCPVCSTPKDRFFLVQ
jgi:rubrerythrin